MLRTIFYIAFTFLALKSQSQQRIVITGTVTEVPENGAKGRPLRDVKVYVENQPKSVVYTNRNGKYILNVEYSDDVRPVIVYHSMLHDLQKREIRKSELRKSGGDTLRIDIVLDFVTLPTVEVSAAPDTVFGSTEVSVSDFQFHGDNFVMLVYEKRIDKGSKVIYTSADGTLLSSFTVPDIAKELYKDFAGRIYLICVSKVYEVTIRDAMIRLLPVEADHFDRQIRPWVDTTEGNAYFSNYLWYYPEFDYFSWSAKDSGFKKIRTVIDKPLMELYCAQYKYVSGREKLEAYRAQKATGVDKEIWIAIWSGFPNSLYYHPLYAPMFVQNDTILIFDHYTNKLFRYNAENEPIDSLDISYHIGPDKKEWEELLVKDVEEQVIYAVYLKGGKYYLKELNTSTGEVKNVYKLTYKYPERLKIRGAYAYYIYRPFESSQKKFLYKEKIR